MPEIRPALSRYAAIAARHPVLTREEELVLARQWRVSGDRQSADRLVRSHLRYVLAIALRYRRYGAPTEELIAEGHVGIMHALGKFDPESGNRFLTYATFWIRAYVLGHVLKSWSIVRGSSALRSSKFFRLRRERQRLTNLLGDADQVAEALAQRLGTTPVQIAKMVQRLDARDASLDRLAFDDAPISMVETMAGAGADPEETLASVQVHQQMSAIVQDALDALDHRERFIVNNRLLTNQGDELSLAEIGRRFGVSHQRVRQLEVRAKDKLRIRIVSIAKQARVDWLVGEALAI